TISAGNRPLVPLIVYIQKQEDCQEFAQDGSVPISKETMVTTGTKHALQCGTFTGFWKEWNRVPRINRTWAAWKNHRTRAFEEQKTIQRITGGGFSANSTTTSDDTEMSNLIITSLDNLAMAAVQNNETVEKLIEMNNQKDRIIASPTDSLQEKKQQIQNSWHYSHKTSSLPKQHQLNLHKAKGGGIQTVTAGATDTESIGNTIARPVTAEKMGTKQEQLGATRSNTVLLSKPLKKKDED
ncbi:hypothetical protein ACHAW6_008041, partial [Cyclotella cf. meneghiniana]